MKIAVMNFTGTVGKTTIAAHLLAPRMNNPQIFAVETINETVEGLGVDVEKIRGERFKDLFKRLLVLDDAIVDIGASNVEAFLDGLVKFEDSQLEFDYFVIPVTSGSKEQKETISLVNTLAEIGIPAHRIRVVFNRVAADAAEEFAAIINFSQHHKTCQADPQAAIFENELFDMLSIKKITIQDALADQTDYKAKAREVNQTDLKTKTHYTDMHVIKALAKSVNRNLDSVYGVLFQ